MEFRYVNFNVLNELLEEFKITKEDFWNFLKTEFITSENFLGMGYTRAAFSINEKYAIKIKNQSLYEFDQDLFDICVDYQELYDYADDDDWFDDISTDYQMESELENFLKFSSDERIAQIYMVEDNYELSVVEYCKNIKSLHDLTDAQQKEFHIICDIFDDMRLENAGINSKGKVVALDYGRGSSY